MSFFGLFGPPNVEKLKAKRDVRGLIKALNYEKDAMVRQTAAEALGEIGEAQAIQSLINALKDEQTEVGTSAIRALKKIGAPVVEPLIEALEKKETRRVMEALGELGDPRAVKPLLATMKKRDWYPNVGEDAKDALVRIGKPAVQPLITAFKRNRSDSSMRAYALKALGEIGDIRALECINAALTDRGSFVELEAAQALAKLEGSQATDALISALHHRDSQVRRTAVQALEERGWTPVDAEQRALRAIAFQEWNLAIEEGTPAVKPLIDALKSSDESLKKDAGYALGAIGDLRAVKPLIARLRDPSSSPSVRRMAAEVLGKLGDASAVEPLIASLPKSVSDHVFVAAIRKVTERGDWAEFDMPRCAVAALGSIGDTRAIGPLINLLVPALKVNKGDRSFEWTRGYWIIDAAREALTKLLDRSTDEVTLKDLHSLANLERAYYFPGLDDDSCGTYSDDSERSFVDCSQLIQLARQELIRRGEQA